MITCRNCGTSYDDASYCNACDLPLFDESAESREFDPQKEAVTQTEILHQARKTAAGIHRILAALYIILLGIGVSILIVSIVSSSGGDSAPRSAGDYAWLLVFAIPATIHIVASEGLLRKKAWARPLSIVIGIGLLLAFPIGTIVGVILLSQMFKKAWHQAE